MKSQGDGHKLELFGDSVLKGKVAKRRSNAGLVNVWFMRKESQECRVV